MDEEGIAIARRRGGGNVCCNMCHDVFGAQGAAWRGCGSTDTTVALLALL